MTQILCCFYDTMNIPDLVVTKVTNFDELKYFVTFPEVTSLRKY